MSQKAGGLSRSRKSLNEVNVHTQNDVPVEPGEIANLQTAVQHVGCWFEEQTMISNMYSQQAMPLFF